MPEQDPLSRSLAESLSFRFSERKRLERVVEADPEDLEARVRLVGLLISNPITMEENALPHVEWLCRNHPREPVVGAISAMVGLSRDTGRCRIRITRAWSSVIEREPDDPVVLLNAARFFCEVDRERAMQLIRAAQAMAPDVQIDPSMLARLGNDHEAPPGSRRELRALQEQALASAEGGGRVSLLEDVARTCLGLGEWESAEAHAKELLELASRYEDEWSRGRALHRGHTILGRVAIRNGDVEAARDALLSSVRIPGSQLRSSRPNMQLALELLERGEKEAVLEYFELCRSFWDRPELEHWALDVRRGRTPRFGANLHD